MSSTLEGYQLISGSPGRSIGLMNKGYNAAMHNGNSYWCECGAWSGYNGGIAGAGGTVTTGYLDLYIRYPDIIMKESDDEDLTAFYNNGVLSKQLIEI